ncbi:MULTISPECIES: fluoride efflux transporter CrcB [Acetobacter]|uniref:Fluoride-specific ion channel FluC n=2 Tax=Acetobacter TaxID=434 RepID=A0A149QKJ5_9PROT|nr:MULTISPECIES: fluoride efflux transporter CrcB [Acetobacter]KXU97818.1 camphor resistance protein CrcB [Acetobacter cerevisiae]NHN89810.1 fluoride efflux transporter CrcB [Acetobacter conturbans]GBQ06978.1 integral membrane protein CrcB [Acetobacter cerevisiae DSM 14362]
MLPNILPTLLIASGDATGTLLRYWVGLATARWSHSLPWGTILINFTGSFAIALFAAMTAAGGRVHISDTTRLVFMVGVCGGYTTFSSFSLQTFDLLQNGHLGRACLNVGISLVLGMIAVFFGFMLAQILNHVHPGIRS